MAEDVKSIVIPQSSDANPNLAPIVIKLPVPTAPAIWHWIISGMIALSSMGATAYFSNKHLQDNFETRLTVIESQRISDIDRLNRIDNKLDQLLMRITNNRP